MKLYSVLFFSLFLNWHAFAQDCLKYLDDQQAQLELDFLKSYKKEISFDALAQFLKNNLPSGTLNLEGNDGSSVIYKETNSYEQSAETNIPLFFIIEMYNPEKTEARYIFFIKDPISVSNLSTVYFWGIDSNQRIIFELDIETRSVSISLTPKGRSKLERGYNRQQLKLHFDEMNSLIKITIINDDDLLRGLIKREKRLSAKFP